MSEDDPEIPVTPGKPPNPRITSDSQITGRTVGDVLDDILVHPRKSIALVSLIFALGAIAFLVVFLLTRVLSVETSEIRLGGSDSHVVFEKISHKTGEYVVVVSPQGWQKAGIPIHQGDHVSFTGTGKICIDMQSLSDEVKLRQKYEQEVADREGIKTDDDHETRVPEDFFTAEQKESLILKRPWVSPGGFSLDKFQPSYRSRRSRHLLPDKPAGGLVAAVIDDSDEPTRADAFFVGRESEYVAARNGDLWFTVNDVQYADPKNPYLFYNDNIGAFIVRITVKNE